MNKSIQPMADLTTISMNSPIFDESIHLEWIKIDGNTALVGITDFAQSELGDIVFIEVETIGEDLNKNEVFGTVEAVKTVSDLFIPVSGKVLEFNSALEDNPELVNESPYEEGLSLIHI